MNKILITAGDPSGIGPEIVVKSLYREKNLSKFIVIGDYFVLNRYSLLKEIPHIKIQPLEFIHSYIGSCKFGLESSNLISRTLFDKKTESNHSFDIKSNKLIIIDMKNVNTKKFKFSKIHKDYGRASIEYINFAINLIKKNIGKILITGPVNKKAIILSGIKNFSGHTEYIAGLTNTKNFSMLMLGKKTQYKLLLLTRHIPLKEVSKNLKIESIVNQILTTNNSLKKYFRIKSPIIGICNINPHLGEFGTIGNEEIKILLPAIKILNKKYKLNIIGPISTEKAFSLQQQKKLSLIVANYHDQAMVPLKILCKYDIINFTCGLPFIRISPGHGTAFDIAGKNIADITSMISCLNLSKHLLNFC